MTFRDDADALRAKLEAAEAENKRLRDEVRRTNAAHEELRARATGEAKAARSQVWAERWKTFFVGVRRTLGAALTGAMAVTVVTGLWVLLDRVHTWSIDRAAAIGAAEQRRLEEMRAHVPEHVNPRLWSWCINHCTRYGMAGGSSAEGVVTEVFADYGNGDGERTRITVRGPWLTGDGASAVSVDFDDDDGVVPGTALHQGDLVLLTHDNHGAHVAIMSMTSALDP